MRPALTWVESSDSFRSDSALLLLTLNKEMRMRRIPYRPCRPHLRPPRRGKAMFHREQPQRLTYRVREVAQMLGVHERTVWKWIRMGLLRPVKVGGATLIPADQLTGLIRAAEPATPPPGDANIDRLAREMLR